MGMFGLSLGASSENSKSSTTGTQTQVGTQNGSQDQNQTQTTGTRTSGSTNQTSVGSQNTSTSGSTTNSGTTNQQQTTTSQSLSDPILSAISNVITGLFSGGNKADEGAQKSAVPLGAFDPTAYVNSALKSAQTRSDVDLSKGISAIFDGIGGAKNSMSQLLAGTLRNNANANLAEVGNQATQTAQSIAAQGATTQAQVGASQDNFLVNLINSLKGGKSTSDAAATTQQAQTGTSATAGTTNTSDASTQNTSSATDSTSQLISLLHTLLNTNETTNVNSNTNTSGTKISAGGTIG